MADSSSLRLVGRFIPGIRDPRRRRVRAPSIGSNWNFGRYFGAAAFHEIESPNMRLGPHQARARWLPRPRITAVSEEGKRDVFA
jgi:hypothetical protein